MNHNTIKGIVLNGLMIALVFVATRFTSFPGPVPPGYINFGDIIILIAALLLGKRSGLIAGAVGSCLADIAAGAFIFAPITLVVKGLEGYIAGAIAEKAHDKKHGEAIRITAIITGAMIMVAGYFVAEMSVLKLFDTNFGLTAAIAELPLNLVQGGISALTGYVISTLLIKSNIRRYIFS